MATGLPSSVTWTPDQRTLASMRRFVLNYTQTVSDSDNESVVTDALNTGIDLLNSRNWHKVSATQDVTLVASTSEYALASDFRDPRACELLDSSDNRVSLLGFRDYKTFSLMETNASTEGDPTIYTVHYDTRKFVLNVAPKSAFVGRYPTARLRYFRRLAHLSQPSDTLDVPPEFASYVAWYGRSEWASIRGTQQQARRADEQLALRWTLLVRDDTDIETDWVDEY